MANGERGEGATPGPASEDVATQAAESKQRENNDQESREDQPRDTDTSKEQSEFTPITEKEEAENLWEQAKDFVEQRQKYAAWLKREQKRDPWAEQVLQQKERQFKENLEHFKGGSIGSFLRSIFEVPTLEEKIEGKDKSFKKTFNEAGALLDQQRKKELFEEWVTGGDDLTPEEIIYAVQKGLRRQAGAQDEDILGQLRQAGIPAPERTPTQPPTEEERQRAERLGQAPQEETRRQEDEYLGRLFRKLPTSDQRQLLDVLREAGARDEEEQKGRAAAWGAPSVPEIERALPRQKAPVRQAISLLEPMYRAYFTNRNNYLIEKGYERFDPMTNEPLQRIPESIFNEADLAGKNAIRELVEELLRAQEEDDAEVRQEDQQQLRSAINTVIADDELRLELATRAQARALAHMGAWTSKYISTEALSQVVTGLLPHHLKELRETEGVSEAIDILEDKDEYGIKGGYYRSFESKTPVDRINNPVHRAIWNDNRSQTDKDKRVALKDVEIKFKIIEQARTSRKTDRRAPHEPTIYEDLLLFEGNDDLIKITLFKLDRENPKLLKKNNPKQAIAEIIRDEPGLAKQAGLISETGEENEERIKEYDRLIYKIDRAFQITHRLHHTFGMSAYWDGPRWKAGTKIPDKYGGGTAKENQLVQLHIKVSVEMPKDSQFPGETIEIDLVTAADEEDKKNRGESVNERIIAAWKQFRSNHKNIAEVTTKAWREFYADKNNWKNIDFPKSATSGGRGARELSRVMNYPLILMHPSEAHPGKESLRKYSYLNVPSLIEMNAYTGAKQLLTNWDSDYYYMKIGWVNSRLRNVEKFKALLTQAKPRLISSSNTLKDFVNSLDEVKDAMRDYLTDDEYSSTMENWVRGMLEFRRNHSQEADLVNLDSEELERQIDNAQTRGLINTKKNEEIRRDMFAPKLLKKLSEYKPFSPSHFPGVLIWKTYEGLDSVLKLLKGLSWEHGIFEAIKEFFRQIFVMPK